MRFGQVLDLLKEGKKLRRPGHPVDDAIKLKKPWSMEKDFKPSIVDGFNKHIDFSHADLFAEDWEIA